MTIRGLYSDISGLPYVDLSLSAIRECLGSLFASSFSDGLSCYFLFFFNVSG